MKSLKIYAAVHYYKDQNAAGGEVMMHAMLSALAKKHDVTAFVTQSSKEGRITIDGVKVKHGMGRTSIFQAKDADLLITHFQNTPYTLQAGKAINVPVVTVVHNDRDATQQLLNITRPTDLTVFNTEWIRDKMHTPSKTMVVHPPVFNEDFETTPGDGVTLVNVAPEKGSDVFYHLVDNLPDVEFLGVEGGYWKAQQVRGGQPNLEFMASTHSMREKVYTRTKVIIMPGRYESYGLVAREAIASGIPVVCHPTPGLKENLGDAGIYIDRDDHDAWVKEVHHLVTDKKYYDKRSKLALERSGHIDSQAELDQFVEAVEGLV